MENQVTLNLETYDNLRRACDNYVKIINATLSECKLLTYDFNGEQTLILHERTFLNLIKELEPVAYQARLSELIEQEKENTEEETEE